MAEHSSLYREAELEVADESCIPDNRLQINVLRLAALRDSTASNLVERVDAYFESAVMTRADLLVTSWNAQTTNFEGQAAGSPPDVTRGVLNYQFYRWPGDELRRDRNLELQALEETKSMVLN